LSEQAATKHDINQLRAELRELEQRLVIKLGGMMPEQSRSSRPWSNCFKNAFTITAPQIARL